MSYTRENYFLNPQELSDTLDCVPNIIFRWNEKDFEIIKRHMKNDLPQKSFAVHPIPAVNGKEPQKYPELIALSIDEILEYRIDGQKLNNIIFLAEIIECNMSFVRTAHSSNEHFESISDFKNCIMRGGEVLLNWKGKSYSITHRGEMLSISESYRPETEIIYTSVDEVLTFKIDNTPLRDVIKQVDVVYRTI